TEMKLNEDGSLTAKTPQGTITESVPVSYQEDGAKVPSKFVLSGNVLGYDIGAYNGQLTIDPGLEWGTYYGGNNTEHGHSINTDGLGGVFCTGNTESLSNISTTGTHKLHFSGFTDAFLSKFTASGTLVWATYYGGIYSESGNNVVIDSKN